MIEQQRAHFESEAPIVAPVIRIERQRLESSARKVHEYVLPLDTAWEVPRENLKFGKVSNTLQARIQYISRKKRLSHGFFYTQVLGMGNFGKVMQATACGNQGETTTVAVKMLKDNHTDQVKSIKIEVH